MIYLAYILGIASVVWLMCGLIGWLISIIGELITWPYKSWGVGNPIEACLYGPLYLFFIAIIYSKHFANPMKMRRTTREDQVYFNEGLDDYCEKCKQRGHGLYDCGTENKINNVQKLMTDRIKKGKFTQVNTKILKTNFLDSEFETKEYEKEYKVFYFNDFGTNWKTAINEIRKEGFEPANLYELLNYSEKYWDGRTMVTALDQRWKYANGYEGVPYIVGWQEGRKIRLLCLTSNFSGYGRFLATKKLSEGNKEIKLK